MTLVSGFGIQLEQTRANGSTSSEVCVNRAAQLNSQIS